MFPPGPSEFEKKPKPCLFDDLSREDEDQSVIPPVQFGHTHDLTLAALHGQGRGEEGYMPRALSHSRLGRTLMLEVDVDLQDLILFLLCAF